MKIAYVASEKNPVPPVKGGAVEHWIYEVAKRLAHNNEVYSFCIRVPQLKNIKDNNGVNVLTYKIGLIGKIMLCTYKLPFKNDTDCLYYLPYSFWCSLKIKKIKADIVHIHARPQFVPILRLLNPRAKILLHVHNVSNIEVSGKLWKKSLFDKVDGIITCSEYLKQEVIKRYPYLTDKSKVLYNGVDTEKFISNQKIIEKGLKEKYRIRPEDLVLLFVGRLVEYKGVHILIEALKDILKIIPNVKLFIVGGVTYSNNQETPYIRSLKEMIHEIEKNIIFTGYIEHSQIPDFINLADIFVVPSLWGEPFGVVTIEAMAMEKPVIAFARGGIKEIINNGKTGILIDEPTKESIVKEIIKLAADPLERHRLGRNARKSVADKFVWDKITEDTLNLYLN